MMVFLSVCTPGCTRSYVKRKVSKLGARPRCRSMVAHAMPTGNNRAPSTHLPPVLRFFMSSSSGQIPGTDGPAAPGTHPRSPTRCATCGARGNPDKTPRNLVVCIDGTANHFGRNVCHAFVFLCLELIIHSFLDDRIPML